MDIRSTFEVAVLQYLRSRPTHGYELLDALGIKSGTLYPILTRLESRGYLEKEEIEMENVPDQKKYSITEEGLDILKEVKKFMGVR